MPEMSEKASESGTSSSCGEKIDYLVSIETEKPLIPSTLLNDGANSKDLITSLSQLSTNGCSNSNNNGGGGSGDGASFSILMKLIGEKAETNEFKLNASNLISTSRVPAASTTGDAIAYNFRVALKEVGRIKQLVWTDCSWKNKNQPDDAELYLYEIRLHVSFWNELLVFPVEQLVKKSTRLHLSPNLKQNEIGTIRQPAHHSPAVATRNKSPSHSSHQLNVALQLIGEKAKTIFVPLHHSQLNHKQPFIPGKKDIFCFSASNVGRINKVIIRNQNDLLVPSLASCFIDSLEVKTLGNPSHVYNFSVNKNLEIDQPIILVPMSSSEIAYEVVLRTNDIDPSKLSGTAGSSSNKHATDIYFIIKGAKGSTKKIYLNNYELKKMEHDYFKEKFYEFKSEDVGKISAINVSINEDDNPLNCVYIDFIEVKIPSRSEAYKFPVERVLGEYVEDGKCELNLEVWKHPERPSHIAYEVISETGADNDKEARGQVYLVIHGNHGRTGKIELNDGNFENSTIDNYEFNAPDVGKISKIELFYKPINHGSAWQLEMIEIKVASRNEAYKFPIHCWLNAETPYLELLPWKKPNINQQTHQHNLSISHPK